MNTDKVIEEFLKSMHAEVLKACPEISTALQLWEESASRTRIDLQKCARSIFDETIGEAAKEAHRQVKIKVDLSWKPIFDQCAKEGGK